MTEAKLLDDRHFDVSFINVWKDGTTMLALALKELAELPEAFCVPVRPRKSAEVFLYFELSKKSIEAGSNGLKSGTYLLNQVLLAPPQVLVQRVGLLGLLGSPQAACESREKTSASPSPREKRLLWRLLTAIGVFPHETLR